MKQKMLMFVGLLIMFAGSRAYAAPLNDACASAQELYITMTGSGSTTLATVDGDSTCGGTGAPDVWYKYYATTTGYLSITTQGSSYDTVISVHDSGINGCPGDDSDTVACNDDCIPGTPGYSCVNNMPIREGHFYYIRVSGYNGATGSFSLSFTKANVSGKVIDAVTSQPIQNAFVYAKSKMDPTYPSNSAASATTDASGNYTLTLPGGSYQILAEKMNYLQEAYDGVLCGDGCSRNVGQTINVSNGGQVNAINFSLELGGTVSGMVTDSETGAPVANAHVYFDATQDGGGIFSSKFTTTNASGNYTMTKLAPGTYYPFVSTAGFVPQLYQDVPCSICAKRTDGTPVFVAAGTATTGIDFELDKGSTISGTVTDESTGLPIQSASVSVRGISGIQTDASGHFSISGVPAGPQVVVAGATQYAWELYSNVPCSWFTTCKTETGTMLNVPANADLEGVNIALAPEGKITVSMTDAVTSLPISSGKGLEILDSTGKSLVNFGCCAGPTIAFTGLAAGTYYIKIGAIDHVTELYNNISCPGDSCDPLQGTPIQVAAGQNVQIGIALTPAGYISGKVSAGGSGLPNALVTIYNQSGTVVADKIEADGFGNYEVDGLPTGTYYVKAEGGATSQNMKYIPRLYNGIDCSACVPEIDGTPVVVTSGAPTTGINITLNQGALITGKIVSAIGGAPLNKTKVSIFNDAGNLVSEGTADGSGQYLSQTAVPSGNYFVYAEGGAAYTSEIYNDILCPLGSCNLFNGTPVNAVLGSTTANINFGLNDCADLSLSPSTIPPMTEGQSYNQQFSAGGGEAPFAFSIVAGSLPGGMNLSSTGALSGTPAAGDFSFVVRVVDANGCMRSSGYSVSVTVKPCLFCDDFQDALAPVDWTYAKGLWSEANGALTATAPGSTAIVYAVPAFSGCTQCYMETTMQTSGGSMNKMWFLAWYQSKSNTVEVLMKEEGDKWIFRQRSGGVIVNKTKAALPINPGQFYTVRVNYTGSTFELSIDGQVVASIPSVGTPFGSVGFQVKNTVGLYGNIMVNN